MVLLTTLDTISGVEYEIIDMVEVTTVTSTNDLVIDPIKLSKQFETAIQGTNKKLIGKAEEMGADAVISVKYFSTILYGLVITAYGTAVKIIPRVI